MISCSSYNFLLELKQFLKKQISENPLVERVVFYDSKTFNLSKKLKKIANSLDNGKILGKTAIFLRGKNRNI